MPIRRRRKCELAPVGAEAARRNQRAARVNVGPRRAVVGRTPDAHVVSRRVDDAGMRRIYRDVRCPTGGPKARREGLTRLPSKRDHTWLEQRERRSAVRRFPNADARPSRNLRDRTGRRRRDPVDATPIGHINRMTGRIIRIDRDLADRPQHEVRVAAKRGPRIAAVCRLVDADSRFGVAGRGVFTSPGIKCVVRRVICQRADRSRSEGPIRDIDPVTIPRKRLVSSPYATARRRHPQGALLRRTVRRDCERCNPA